MNRWTNIISRRERHALLTVLLLSLALSCALGAVWWKLRTANRDIVSEMEQIDLVLHSFRESPDMASLSERLVQAQQDHARLQVAWEKLSSRIDSFAGENRWPLDGGGATVEGRIDFKVALFNARTNLQQLARENQRILPPGLGMDETIDADEPAETRLWQLATVVRLLEGAIELGIPTIQDIAPLAPVDLLAEGDPQPIAREFPVQVAMECTYASLMESLDAMLGHQATLGLRRIYVRKAVPDPDEVLRVQLVYTAALLPVPGFVPDAVPAEAPPLTPDPTPAALQGDLR